MVRYKESLFVLYTMIIHSYYNVNYFATYSEITEVVRNELVITHDHHKWDCTGAFESKKPLTDCEYCAAYKN